jgi:superfamily II DNA or RNA helicase
VNPRPYQSECLGSIIERLRTERATLAVLATGLGKTVIFSLLAKIASRRVLVVAHRDELIQQAADKIERVTGIRPDIEMGDSRSREGDAYLHRPKIVVASVQSISRKSRLNRFRPHQFGLVVIDEAHRSVAPSYLRVVEHFSESKVVGFTATPDRLDNRGLKTVFESVAYRMDIHDGIEQGWLVPITCVRPKVHLDLDGIESRGGDFVESQLQQRILESEGVLHEYARGIVAGTRDRRTIVFCDSVRSAEQLSDILNRPGYGVRASWICGDPQLCPKERRRATIQSFRQGSITHLVNVGIATEGFDVPEISAVAVCRPTKSRALYTQMTGRGTRPPDGLADQHHDAASRRTAIASSVKSDMLLVDFTYGTHDHVLAGPADLLGEAMSEEERAAMMATLADSSSGMSLDEARAKAKEIVELKEKQKAMDAERRRADRARRKEREMVAANGDVAFEVVDVMGRYGIARDVAAQRVTAAIREGGKLTGAQLTSLRKQVPDCDDMPSALQRSLYKEMVRRRIVGECTLKQAKILRKAKLDPHMKFDEARRALDELFARR